ncbi:MAG: hypothetical protein ABR536_06655 [Solirubrobacterales bacterium]
MSQTEASGRGHGNEATGGVAVGRRVRVPRGARGIEVYINGVRQRRGVDYDVSGEHLVFREPIIKEGRLGFARWMAMLAGLFGSYGKNEAVDLHYRLNGATKVASDVEVLPD